MRKNIITVSLLFLLSTSVQAQFTVVETFKGSAVGSNIITGGSAILTSGNADPVNDGWLRLTPSSGNQKGYAYVNSSFPSTLGVIMEFEYKSWRNTYDSYNGADGFCLFLFDAATSTFTTGGYGGSLGYAPNTVAGTTTGLSGGYLGVGFDEYGNFSNTDEGRNGGVGLKCNSVTMRGPTTANASTTNTYLTSTQLQTSASSNTNSIDWNTTTTTRPTDTDFYRKVKITILPTGTGKYDITVYWQTSTTGSYTQLLTYQTTTAPPAYMKLGFAASTGGGFNFHEIRNLYITTLGNVRVQKAVDKANVNVNGQVTYTVNVTNDSPAILNNVIFADTLKNGSGTPLVLGTDFDMTSITFNNNGNTGTTAAGFTSGTAKTTGFTNPWNTTLNMAASSTASFTIVGTIKNQPAGNIVRNLVGIDPYPSGITDQDLTNNTSKVETTVLTPNVDFTINKTVDSPCADATNGNTYTIVVSNMGAAASANNRTVTVTDVIPAGFTVQSTSGTGWTITNSGSTYTFTRVNNSLLSSYSYPPITIKVTPPATGVSWTNTATVAYTGIDANTSNNSSSVTLYCPPAAVAPVTGNDYVIVGSTIQLSSTTTGGSWSSSNTTIASVNNSTGVVTGVKSGSVTIYYTVGTGCTKMVSKTIQVYNKNYWVGSVSTDWNVTSNWSDNRIPLSGEDVEYATLTNLGNPAVRDLYVPALDPKIIGNLINASSVNLVIPAGTSLTVNAAAQMIDTNPYRIQIQADATKPNGSLVFKNPQLNSSVYATVQMYSKAQQLSTPVNYTIDGVNYTSTYSWQFFGIPVKEVATLPAFYGSAVRIYNESQNLDVRFKKWTALSNSSSLYAFKGYEITQPSPKIIDIQGILNTSDVTLSLTKTISTTPGSINYASGQTIVGNSFAAAIDISKIQFPVNDDVDKTVYLYNTGSFGIWYGTTGTGALGTTPGTYFSIPQEVSPVVGKEIPSMQGFLLKVKNAAAGTYNVTIPYNSVTSSVIANTTQQRVKHAASPTDEFSYMSVDVAGANEDDRVLLFSQPGTSHGFDNGWDGEKLIVSSGTMLYVDEESGKYQVNTANDLEGTYLSFRAGSDTNYTLQINKTNLSGYPSLYLTDLVTGEETDLSAVQTADYSFTATNTASFDKRFVLSRVSKIGTGNPALQSSLLKIYSIGKIIRIQNKTNENGSFKMFDLVGKELYSGVFGPGTTTDINTGLSEGVYLVKLRTAGINQSEKVLLK